MPPLIDWLRKVVSGDGRAELVISPQEDRLAGLSLTAVLEAHQQWRERLTGELQGAQADLCVSEIARDDRCTLGQWLGGPGRERFGHLPEYQQACRAHSAFHRCAGELLLGRQAGQPVAALRQLEGRMHDASSHNQLELVRLFAAAHA